MSHVRLAAAVMAVAVLGAATAAAQPPAPEPGPIAADAPIVLRPQPALRRMTERVARVLAQRIGVRVQVGDGPPPEVVEAVPAGHVALVQTDGRVQLVLGGTGGRTFATELELGNVQSDASVRAVALALESLRDAGRGAPSIEPPEEVASGIVAEEGTIRTRWRMLQPFAGRAHPFREPPPANLARPTLFARFLLGVSGERGTFLYGPGIGLGLCVRSDCVVLEGDLPIPTQDVRASDGAEISYRFVTFSMRFQWRPLRWGPFTPGLTGGLVTRIGTITLEGTSTDRVETSLGVRGTVEIAWEFVRRFELVLEGGLDVAVDRAQFHRVPFGGRAGPEPVFLEDRFTPWAMTSVRVRP